MLEWPDQVNSKSGHLLFKIVLNTTNNINSYKVFIIKYDRF